MTHVLVVRNKPLGLVGERTLRAGWNTRPAHEDYGDDEVFRSRGILWSVVVELQRNAPSLRRRCRVSTRGAVEFGGRCEPVARARDARPAGGRTTSDLKEYGLVWVEHVRVETDPVECPHGVVFSGKQRLPREPHSGEYVEHFAITTLRVDS
jgi:hypothetical protein